MIRFIMALLGKQYEPCKGCEVLRQQLAVVNEEKKELTQTLIEIVKPKPPEITRVISGQPVSLPVATSFSRRRAILENRDREAAKVIKESPFVAKPDDPRDRTIDNAVEELERELNISSGEKEPN